MKVYVFLVCFALHILSAYGLICQVCDRVKSLDQCPQVTHCAADEECYVDEIITASGIFFNAGCRSKTVCRVKNDFHLPVGKRSLLSRDHEKRDANDLVACSRCCDHDVILTNLTSSVKPCNTRLCGLPSNAGSSSGGSTGSGPLTCYECDHANNFGEDCNGVTTCPDTKVCGTQTQSTASGDSHTYNFGCFDKRFCTELTKRVILLNEQMEKANQTTAGRRSERRMCNICCGGSYCNTGDCTQLERKLYKLYNDGHLNLDTLEYI